MNINKVTPTEWFLWLFSLVLILTLLAPLIFGFKIKNDYPVILKNLSNTLNVEIKLVNYEQHFFSSTLDLTLKIPGFNEILQFREKIIHGPVYFGLLAQGKSPFVAAVIQGELKKGVLKPPITELSLIQKIFSNNDMFVYQASVSYLGDIDSQFYLPAMDTRFQSEIGFVHINSAGVIINQHYLSATQKIRIDIILSSIKFKSKHFALNVDAVNLSFAGERGLNHILMGDSIISAGLLNFYSGVDQFALKGMVLRSISSEQNHLINVENQLNVHELLSSNQKFGPLMLDLDIKGINIAHLKKVKQQRMPTKERPIRHTSVLFIGQNFVLNADVIKQIEMTLSPFSVDSELGKLQLKLALKVDPASIPEAGSSVRLLSAIDFDLDVSIDDGLLKQLVRWDIDKNIQALFDPVVNAGDVGSLPASSVDKRIQGLLKGSWLVNSVKGYRSKVSMQKGQLQVNNKTFMRENGYSSATMGVADIYPKRYEFR